MGVTDVTEIFNVGLRHTRSLTASLVLALDLHLTVSPSGTAWTHDGSLLTYTSRILASLDCFLVTLEMGAIRLSRRRYCLSRIPGYPVTHLQSILSNDFPSWDRSIFSGRWQVWYLPSARNTVRHHSSAFRTIGNSSPAPHFYRLFIFTLFKFHKRPNATLDLALCSICYLWIINAIVKKRTDLRLPFFRIKVLDNLFRREMFLAGPQMKELQNFQFTSFLPKPPVRVTCSEEEEARQGSWPRETGIINPQVHLFLV